MSEKYVARIGNVTWGFFMKNKKSIRRSGGVVGITSAGTGVLRVNNEELRKDSFRSGCRRKDHLQRITERIIDPMLRRGYQSGLRRRPLPDQRHKMWISMGPCGLCNPRGTDRSFKRAAGICQFWWKKKNRLPIAGDP